MKFKTNNYERRSTVVFFLIVFMIVGLYASGNAQGFRRYGYGRSQFVLGIEGGISTRSFHVKSDVEAINNLQVNEEGWSAGLVAGGKNVRAKLLFGSYKGSSTMTQDVDQTTYTGQVNFYPLGMMGVKSKYFKPYILAGLDINRIKFFGTSIPKLGIVKAAKKEKECACTCTSGMPADPDLGASSSNTSNSGSPGTPGDPGSDPDIINGGTGDDSGGIPGDPDALGDDPDTQVKPSENILTATQGIVGVGLEMSFNKRGRMFSMFSEAKYGIQMSTNTLSQGLVNTSISNQWTIYFGVAIGLSK